MKYKVKWIEDHMGITRNMIRRYEKKGVISKNEEGKDREFDEEGLRQLWDIRVLGSLGKYMIKMMKGHRKRWISLRNRFFV